MGEVASESTRWEVEHSTLTRLPHYLDAGWEPFAATETDDGATVWLRRPSVFLARSGGESDE